MRDRRPQGSAPAPSGTGALPEEGGETASGVEAAGRAMRRWVGIFRTVAVASLPLRALAAKGDRRSRWGTAVLTAALGVEGLWLWRRLEDPEADPRRLWATDTAFTAAAVLANARDCVPGRTTNPMLVASLMLCWGTAATWTVVTPGSRALTGAAALGLAHYGGVLLAREGLGPAGARARARLNVVGDVMAATLVTHAVAVLFRNFGRRADAGRAGAETAAERLGEARERSRQDGVLFDGALGALDTIAGDTTGDLSALRRRARREALRLRRALSGPGGTPGGFLSGLWDLAADAAGAGVSVDLVTSELTGEPAPEEAAAFFDACAAARPARPAGAGARRVVLRARREDGAITVTLRPRGPRDDTRATPEAADGVAGLALLRDTGVLVGEPTGPDPGYVFRLPVSKAGT